MNVNKGLRSAIQTEFDKTNLERIGFEWKTPALNYDFPEIDLEDSIVAISKNGTKFETIVFLSWNKFSNLFDLLKILE